MAITKMKEKSQLGHWLSFHEFLHSIHVNWDNTSIRLELFPSESSVMKQLK
jgi:hypothetical protein